MSTNNRRDEEERKGAGIPLLTRGQVPQRALRWLFTAPEAWLARAGVAAAVALNLAWLAAAVAMPPDVARVNAKSFSSNPGRPTLAMTDAMLSPRGMITGFKAILAPDFAAVESAPVPAGADASAPPPLLPDVGSNLPRPDKAGKGDEGGKGEEGKDGKDKSASEAAAAALKAGGAAAPGAGGGAAMGGLAGVGSGGSASSGASLATRGSEQAGFVERDRKAMGQGRRTIARTPVRSSRAMDQLRFAQGQSNKGKMASTSGSAYTAADTAFQGQAAQPGGIPAVGAGATNTPPPAASSAGEGGPTISRGVAPKPAAAPVQNVTPYQDLVELARKFLIAAAVLAVLGIFLLIKGGPGTQLIGGLLLGAAAALAIAAMAIGNTIESEYGQKPQKQAIDDAAKRSLNP